MQSIVKNYLKLKNKKLFCVTKALQHIVINYYEIR